VRLGNCALDTRADLVGMQQVALSHAGGVL
jgi:hypothetical protein